MLHVHCGSPARIDLELVSEMFVCSMRSVQIWCVEHRDDGEPGFRVVVDVFAESDGDEEYSQKQHVGFHVHGLLRYAGMTLREDSDVSELPVVQQIDIAWNAFRSMPRSTQLILAAADLELRLGDSLTEEEIERYRPLERLMRADQERLPLQE